MPWGERSHGIRGIYESYGELLGIKDHAILFSFLGKIILGRMSQREMCPCGSNIPYRKCHKKIVQKFFIKIPITRIASDYSFMLQEENMQKILPLSGLFPILFVVLQFLWGEIPKDHFPEQIISILNDALGPVFLMILVINITCFWLWKIPGFNLFMESFFGTNIYIQGTWKGLLHYNYEGKKSKTAYLVIHQRNIFSLAVSLLTDERISTSRTASIISEGGIRRLIYEYGTEDSSENKDKNPLHTGFCALNISSNGSKKILSGLYYTSRNTTGKIELTQRNKKIVTNYQLAEELFIETKDTSFGG